MIARQKFELTVVAGMCLMMAVAAKATGTGDENASTTAGDGSLGKITRPVGNLSSCVDLKGDCSTLMVNYYSDSVEFALFQRGKYGGSTAADPADAQDASQGKHSNSNELAASDGQEKMLGIDFLRGLQDKGDVPVLSNHPSDTEKDSLAVEGMHDWAFAAAKSLSHKHKQNIDHHSNFVPSHLVKDLTTFWDFEHVYQWQVDVKILDDGASDLSQVVLSNIYLSAKTNSRSDPRNVVCALSNPDDC
ncbi:Uncharacterised protein [Halioglobus japonicus]|nr:Uncharacterised protein [Halioglobus japonicus]